MTTMKAWVLGDPGQLILVDKPVPSPGVAEVLVRIDATAICATDLEVISHGPPATIGGEPPFNKNFTPGHEYMGTIVEVGPTVDEFAVGERVAVEIHAGCGRCERCRQGIYLVPELRPQLRRVQQGAPGQRIHNRRRLRAVCGQSRQHARPRARACQRRSRDVDRDGRHRDAALDVLGRTRSLEKASLSQAQGQSACPPSRSAKRSAPAR